MESSRALRFLKEWQSLIVGIPALAFTGFTAWIYIEEVRRVKGPD
jgi:hypothetical protein